MRKDHSGLINAMAAVSLSLLSGCTSLKVSQDITHSLTQNTRQAALTVGGLTLTQHTSQPIGAYNLCHNTGNCPTTAMLVEQMKPRATPIGSVEDLNEFNAAANGRFKQQTDMALYGKEEVWTYPKTGGDCEDFSIYKQAGLRARGIDPRHLAIAVVRQKEDAPNGSYKKGDGHAVLLAEWNNTVYVLDNLRADAQEFADAVDRLQFVKASNDMNTWFSFGSDEVSLIASVQSLTP